MTGTNSYDGRSTDVYSEVAPLRTILLHRPGRELNRLTPRNNDALLFDGVPWVERAQEEHDAFADVLRARGVEVLMVGELLAETLQNPPARTQAIESAVGNPRLGPRLRSYLSDHLDSMSPFELAETLIAGIAKAELPHGAGLVFANLGARDFVLSPLPNMMFTRDSSVWFGEEVAVTSLATPARVRESAITELIYSFHPRFAAASRVYGPELETLEGGDVLLLAPGVVAVGMGGRTDVAGAERLAGRLLERGHAQTVVAVAIPHERATIHLDTLCTMVDVDTVIPYPELVDSAAAYTLTADGEGGVRIDGPKPFLTAAAAAMGIDRLRVVEPCSDAVIAEREQWDDAHNTLALSPGVVVAYERNKHANSLLEKAGIEVIPIAGSEMGSGRGGPRCLSCAVSRSWEV
ncbi:arginine deiminase [Micromonospora sp. AKA38]|uniref:arginine deiminase n=1 Tax=Micromonospora sp. AKA38 TaxID=2733861 RepID=UPI0022CA38D2|nr:arginine deiminase [Micromonospora sp. AKA38]GHJ15489.1 arginine deiminase [Micromonospora sp. AKA38]